MRVLSETVKEGVKIYLFSWNNKYLLKFEWGPFEQVFKIPEEDVLDIEDLKGFNEGEFFEDVKNRFNEMGESLQKQNKFL
jgi:hypothetical protein